MAPASEPYTVVRLGFCPLRLARMNIPLRVAAWTSQFNFGMCKTERAWQRYTIIPMEQGDRGRQALLFSCALRLQPCRISSSRAISRRAEN
jgi:hypothetical protein